MPVNVIDTIKPKNNGTFPVVEAADVKVAGDQRLPAALNAKANNSDLSATNAAVALKANQSTVDSLIVSVNNKANQSTVDALSASIAGKAEASDVAELIEEIALKADASDVETTTTNLQSQIDNLVTPVTEDAEVQNARVSQDGSSFTTLKQRLDFQDSELAKAVDDAELFEDTIIDLSTMTVLEGYYIRADSTVGNNEPGCRIAYMPCKKGVRYTISRAPSSLYLGIAYSRTNNIVLDTQLYDRQYTFAAGALSLKVPEDAVCIAICYYDSDAESVIFKSAEPVLPQTVENVKEIAKYVPTKCKNLDYLKNCYIRADSTIGYNEPGCRVTYMTCEPNTMYVVKRTSSSGQYLGVAYSKEPTIQVEAQLYGKQYTYADNLLTITTGDDAILICVCFYDVDADVVTLEKVSTDVPASYDVIKSEEVTWTASKCIISTSENQARVGIVDEATTAVRVTGFIPTNGYKKLYLPMIIVSGDTPVNYGMCFYDINKKALWRSGESCYTKRTDVYAKEMELNIPENACYFRTTYWTDNIIEQYCPDMPFVYRLSNVMNVNDGITHELPTSAGMRNAICRARQLTDINWAPLVEVPRSCLCDGDYSIQNGINKHFIDYCEVEKEYTGIPYSGSGQVDTNWSDSSLDPNSDAGKWGYRHMFVGNSIDFETFVTAARYEDSIFGERKEQSSYSFYSSPYGSVCVALVQYALGLPGNPKNSPDFCTTGWPNYFFLIGDISTINTNNIKLCDILYHREHVSIITDIVRDSNGTITHIEISQATTTGNACSTRIRCSKAGGFCRRSTMPIERFLSVHRYYKLYRFKGFGNIDYTPSEYAPVGNEPKVIPIVDMPCIPYLGNKANYKLGYIRNSKILIGDTGFTKLKVTRNGVMFGTFDVNGANYVEVGFSELGNYQAWLENDTGTNRSRTCEWNVINVNDD